MWDFLLFRGIGILNVNGQRAKVTVSDDSWGLQVASLVKVMGEHIGWEIKLM